MTNKGIYIMGQDNLSGKKKYTNGIISKFFYPGSEPEGWWQGCTEEYAKKKSIKQKENWQNEDYRNNQQAIRSTASYREKIVSNNIKAWEDDEKRQIWCEHLKRGAEDRWDDESEHIKASIKMQEKWKDPSYRDTQSEAIKKGHENIYLKHPEYIKKIAQGNIETWAKDKFNILLKQAYSKTMNSTWNTSKMEENLYIELVKEYGKENIERQYDKDPRYPFRCDFYIKSEDLFIELQGTWMHGKHPFDSNNTEDLAIVEEWEKKALEHPQYKGAIEIWTKRDVLKKEYTIKNNLNIKFIY